MRATVISLVVFWTLISLAIGSPLAQAGKPALRPLNIGTPERIARATEIVNKRYQDAERITREILADSKNVTKPLNITNVKDVVYCRDQPQVDKKAFETAHEIFKDWCESEDGGVSPFSHQYYDHGNVRLALCNWGLWNPCRGDELESAWQALNLVCPEQGSGNSGAPSVTAGMWYKGAWLKGYFRSNCTTGDLCDGDRTGVACMNDD
ncbi:hypothetical protein PG989_016479 [Apiospora arundinis]